VRSSGRRKLVTVSEAEIAISQANTHISYMATDNPHCFSQVVHKSSQFRATGHLNHDPLLCTKATLTGRLTPSILVKCIGSKVEYVCCIIELLTHVSIVPRESPSFERSSAL